MDWLHFIYVAVGWILCVGMILVVLHRSFAPGAAIAWLGIFFLHPYAGLTLYVTFGESRLGLGRIKRHIQLQQRYAVGDGGGPPPDIAPATAALSRLACKVGRMPVVPGNRVEFLTNSVVLIERLVADIDAAGTSIHLLYYILGCDSSGEKITAAVERAARRGVTCRLLLDAFASRNAFRRDGVADRLRSAGVEVVPALPSAWFRRRDLRNHRKLAVIDNRIGYAGSQNLINADYGGKRGGPWVDCSGRFQGPVLAEFATVFASDWAFESGRELDVLALSAASPMEDGIDMQVVPTGPTGAEESYRRLFLGAITSAQSQLTLTTPYFVPDDATMVALQIAADRGVHVRLIVPMRSDNRFTAAAGRAQYARLLHAGIEIYQYKPGLIHTKLVTVDDTVAVFGSANLDVRSFHLNFELSTLLFGKQVVAQLLAIQQGYITDSIPIELAIWNGRPAIQQYLDSAVSLISPLL